MPWAQPLSGLGKEAAEGLTLGEYFSPFKGSLGLTSPGFSLLSTASTTSFSSGLPDPWLPWLGLMEGEEPFPLSQCHGTQHTILSQVQEARADDRTEVAYSTIVAYAVNTQQAVVLSKKHLGDVGGDGTRGPRGVG